MEYSHYVKHFDEISIEFWIALQATEKLLELKEPFL